MWLVIEDHDNLFIMAEFVHFAGIGMLLYKLFSKKNAGGKLLRYTGCRSEQPLLLSYHIQLYDGSHSIIQVCL